VIGVGSPFIIKVDRRNGGSSDFFMGYEDIPPGRAIPRHYHPHVDEILFVHRGSGVATLGSREARVTEGATIYIPPNTRVSLRNTGTEPLTIVFLFPQSELGDYFRDASVAEGQQAVQFTPEEFAAMRARHREHITFEPQ
jgi:oxalate decarboxylase/phosphoglucose isomerase-like protein (cupin superfamily)